MLMKSPRQPGQRWSEDDITDICSRYGKESASIIGAQYGVTRNAIIGVWMRARDAGAAMPPVRPPEKTVAEAVRVPKERLLPKVTKPLDWPPATASKLAREKFEPRRYAKIKCEPVGLLEAKECHCRYWIGRGDNGLALFCGAKVEPGISWCPGHAKVVCAKPADIPSYLRQVRA